MIETKVVSKDNIDLSESFLIDTQTSKIGTSKGVTNFGVDESSLFLNIQNGTKFTIPLNTIKYPRNFDDYVLQKNEFIKQETFDTSTSIYPTTKYVNFIVQIGARESLNGEVFYQECVCNLATTCFRKLVFTNKSYNDKSICFEISKNDNQLTLNILKNDSNLYITTLKLIAL